MQISALNQAEPLSGPLSGPESPRPEEYDSLIQFLNLHLRNHVNWSIADEYPQAMSRHDLKNMTIIRVGEKIASHSLIDVVDLSVEGMHLKVGMIGSVVTDPEFRKRGLGRQCIEKCVAMSQENDCDLNVLWTYEYGYYRKVGFERAGHETCVYLDKSQFLPQAGIVFSEEDVVQNTNLAKEIIELYNTHGVRVERSVELQSRYLTIPKIRVFSARDERGKLLAFAFEGKGADLNSCLHDWAGPADVVANLFHYAKEKLGSNVIIMIPGHRTDITALLEPVAERVARNPFGMVRILNHSRIIQEMTSSNPKDADGLMKLVEKQKQIDPLSVSRFFFGDLDFEAAKFTAAEKELYLKYLPLPIWIWGLDAV